MVDESRTGRSVFVYQTNSGGEAHEVVSILDSEVVFEYGLCPEAILGILRPVATGGRRITPERFQENPAFVQYLRTLLSDHVYDLDGLRRAAQDEGDGHLYLIDGRTPDPDGEVPAADIIGAVQAESGVLVPGSYQHNPNHRLLTQHGFFELPAELEAILQTDLRRRCAQPR